jgi:hypothetical protein
VGIHQPNYFPGISYFCKILYSDIFIFLDSVQFSKGNWTNRNRIKSAQGELLLTVPVFTTGKSSQMISETSIVNRTDWRQKHLKSIYQNYYKAACFKETFPVIEEIFNTNWENLSEMNVNIIKRLCTFLAIERCFILSSEIESGDLGSTDLLIHLITQAGGDTYISGAGGRKYMEMDKFAENHLEVRFLTLTGLAYLQRFKGFLPNLSIIDLLFNEGPEAVRILRESALVE